MCKKIYSRPEIDTVVISQADILLSSDVLIDGSDLFGKDK